MGLVSWLEEEETAFTLWEYREKAMEGHSEKAPSETYLTRNPAGTLIFDAQPPELLFLLFQPGSL